MRRISGFAGLVAAAGVACAQPAHSQAWIGQVVGNMIAQQQAAAAEAACMAGQPPAAAEVAEALGPVNRQMQAYFAAVHAGTAPRSAFFALDEKARLTLGSETVGRAGLDRGTEPFAGQGLLLDAEPIGFVRSGLDAFALGQWPVRDADGTVAGVYTGFFVRKLGQWKLRTLSFETAAEYAGAVEQFCHAPGDVLPYRLATGERMTAWHAKRLAKAEAKAAATAAQEAKAAARAGQSEAALRARQHAEEWAAEVVERRAALEKSRAEWGAAKEYEAAAPARKASARSALGLT